MLSRGGTAGRADARLSFLGHPTRSFSCGQPRHPAIGRSAPSAGAPASPPARKALHSQEASATKCYPCSRSILLPIFPVAHIRSELRGTERTLTERSDQRATAIGQTLTERFDQRATTLEQTLTERFDQRATTLEQTLTERFDQRATTLEQTLTERFVQRAANLEQTLTERFEQGATTLEQTLTGRFEQGATNLERTLTERFDDRATTLEQTLTTHFDERLTNAESTLGERFQKELGATELRLSEQYKTAVEAVRYEVRLAAEGYGGTLEAVQRDIHALDVKFSSTLQVHAKVLAQHSRDIDELKGRG